MDSETGVSWREVVGMNGHCVDHIVSLVKVIDEMVDEWMVS